MRKFCVLYMVGRKEHRSPWFKSLDRAKQARDIIAAKHGATLIYAD